MTISGFEMLRRDEQVEMLYRDGVYIGKEKVLRKSIIYYQLGSFYVELIYTKYRNSLLEVRCFTGEEKITGFLDEIDVDELLQLVNM